MAPVWHNLKAFGGVARAAQHLARGQMVRVSGKQREEIYEREGEAHRALSLLVVHIEAADVNPTSGAAGRQDHGRGQTDEPRDDERMRHASPK
jgi:single-stranded DNA-binding protein